MWWRQFPHGGDPLFRSGPPGDGRWQRGETVGGLYFAQDEQTAWAEWYRVLAEFAVPPDRQMPRDLWRWQVDAPRVADLSDAARLSAVQLPPPRPNQHEWPAFQTVGEELEAQDKRAGAGRTRRENAVVAGRHTATLMASPRRRHSALQRPPAALPRRRPA